MLERATTCLDSGARFSAQQCTRRAPRSRRLLHSTFWNHGAGDLDLPPWSLPSAAPRDILPKHDDTDQHGERGRKRRLQRTATSETQTPFLDFLHPPQALAWLQNTMSKGIGATSTTGGQWDRWERRNARRLADHLAQPSRGYTSKSRAHLSEMRTVEQEEDEESDSLDKILHQEREQLSSHADNPHSKRWDDMDAAFFEEMSSGSDNNRQRLSSVDPNTENMVSDGLDQTSSSTRPSDTTLMQQKLREVQFLEDSRERGFARDELAKEVWERFSSLSQDQQDDMAYKVEMLQLLAQFKSVVAAKHYTTLLNSIPKTEWTHSFLKPLMEMHLQQRRFGQVFIFHSIATIQLPLDDAISITLWLLAELIGQRQWEFATRILSQAADGRQHYLEEILEQLPTLLRGEPKMFTLACSLTRYNDKQDLSRQASLQGFCSLVIKSGLRHLVRNGLSLHNDPLRMPYIRKMLEYLRVNDPSAIDFSDYLIWKTVSPGYQAMRDIEVYRLLSAVFRNYLEIEGAQPSETLLLSLQRWVERYSKLHPMGTTNPKMWLSLDEIVKAWNRYYSQPSLKAVKSLLAHHAFQGNVEQVQRWKTTLRAFRADYPQYKDALRSLIYVHSKRGDVKAAGLSFAEVKEWAAGNDEVPDLSCWNALIFAHLRADDAQGAINTLVELITTTELEPDAKSVQPVMELLAKRGDVEGVQELAQQYDHVSGHKRTTAMVGSLLNAHVNVGEMETAEKLLVEATRDTKAGKIEGSLTTCFNIIITAHALRRDLEAATDTYRWMQSEGVKLNEDTFAALMQALVTFRKSDAAFKILRKVMPRNGLKPSAFHYAIVLTGYVNQGILTRNTFTYIKKHMAENKVKPSISTEVAFRKAEILRQQRHNLRSMNPTDLNTPLETVIGELETTVRQAAPDIIYGRQRPLPGLSLPGTTADALAARYDLLIEIHGARQCFQAVRRVYEAYMAEVRRHGFDEDAIPMRMMSALMSAYVKAGQYNEVERCWQFVKSVADRLTQPLEIPSLSNKPVTIDQFGRLPLVDNKRRRVLASRAKDGSSSASPTAKPVRGRQNILSRPLQSLIEARAAQSRLPSAVTVTSNLLSQGYTFDNTTWNYFIETLCRAQPPYTLLAFVLAERFLMPNWPKWKYHREPYYPLKRSEVKQSMQHIRARYLAPGQLMPFYKTLVWMGRALLELRDHDAGVADWTVAKEMEGYVGSLDRLRSRAPTALLAVQEMPRMSDGLQDTVLKEERLHNLG
ncbi:hypothetical protein K431DRAFT_251524 [Polychaeton citri CBS 116435]|uniref:Pentacotripeptide-repeat region of PRORP domain-containing protein n=1 Tax=Polychaeton citri CBS 116435 TaxID=1314669 RepID=A0A9P4UNR4_9PEZI|nr:hypothetical protein K431DRAFT_251524 [Polychaeton citri CBS 116435]